MKYNGVRKVEWDQLWHALYVNKKGREMYDRVNRGEALRIEKKIRR